MNDRRPVVPEGLDAANAQIVLHDGGAELSERARRVRLILGITWTVLGSAFVPMIPIVANVLLAFGMASIMVDKGIRERMASLLLSLAVSCGVSVLLVGEGALPLTVISVACAFGFSWVMVAGKLRTWQIVVASVLVMGVLLAIDAALTSMQGTSVTELVTMAVDESVEANLDSLDLTSATTLLETRDSLLALWPTLYYVVTLCLVACSLAGAWMGARTCGAHVEPQMMARFDAPLWVALCLAAGALSELLSGLLPAGQEQLRFVGANLAACARILLTLQGLSVLLWWLYGRGATSLVRTSIVMLGIWCELSFALTSVVGLVDMAINFRGFERRRPSLSMGSIRER